MASDFEFDENISSVISLSKIFDGFMTKNESPRTILDFLLMYKEKSYDILHCSDSSPRLFSADFIKKCSPVELNVFAEICATIAWDGDKREHYSNSPCIGVEKLFWIVKVGRCFSSTVKNMFKACLNQVYGYEKYGHSKYYSPYTGTIGNEYLEFDKMFFNAEKPCDYAAIINDMSIETLAKFAKNCEWKSLVAQRILQEDVFICLDDVRKFVFLKHGAPFNTMDYKKGLKQLVCGCLDEEVKKYVCEIIQKSGPSFVFSNFMRDICLTDFRASLEDETARRQSFNEIVMRLEISGNDRSCDWIVYDLLAKYGLDYVKKGAKAHRLFLANNFDILDLVD